MPTREDLLYTKTHKGGVDTDPRVYYCLSGSGDAEFERRPKATQAELRTHRKSKLLAMIVARLEAQGLLSADDIDDMLLDIVTR
jgi:hypothetical protein